MQLFSTGPTEYGTNCFIETYSLYESPIGVCRGNGFAIAQIYIGLLTLHKLGCSEGIRGETLFGGHFR